jgi:hypothetical protein
MVKLVVSNLVLALVAFLLGFYWPRESPEAIILRYPPPSCGAELERLRSENERLSSRIQELRSELSSREDVVLIVREAIKILLEEANFQQR